MRKVGIMGGTFDPIHVGHLLVAEHTREALKMDGIWFMPAADPPHKSHQPSATAEERLQMVRQSVESNPAFYVTDIEIKRGGVSYTIDTINELQSDYPDVMFSFIIGADMVNYLPKWHKIEELVKRISFIGVHRPGTLLELDHLPAYIRNCVTMVEMPLIDISSTQIRDRAARGLSIRYMVPDPVYQFFQRNDNDESKS